MVKEKSRLWLLVAVGFALAAWLVWFLAGGCSTMVQEQVIATTTTNLPATTSSTSLFPTTTSTTTTSTPTTTTTMLVSGWQTAELIDAQTTGTSESPSVAMDANGNGVVIWRQYDGPRYDLWGRYYNANTGWTSPVKIENDDAGDVMNPHVAMSASGKAVAVWTQSDGSYYRASASLFDPSSGWGAPQMIDTSSTYSSLNPCTAIDPDGNAIAIWDKSDGKFKNVIASYYSVSAGWSSPAIIVWEHLGDAEFPAIAMDANGNAVASWTQTAKSVKNVWANIYAKGAGWGVAVSIESQSGNAFNPAVAVNSNGDAIVAWMQSNHIFARNYSGGNWGTAEVRVEESNDQSFVPQVVIDSNGHAIAVWFQYNGSIYNIWANKYDPLSGWGTKQMIETHAVSYADFPDIGMDSQGNARVAYRLWSMGTGETWAVSYLNGGGWGSPQKIDANAPGYNLPPQIAVSANGDAIAVWERMDPLAKSYGHIWSNRYVK